MSFGMNFGQSGYSGYNPYGGQQNPYASFANNMSLGAVNNQFYSPLMQSPFLQNSYGISMQANPLFNQGAWSSMVDMAAQNHDYLKTLMNNQPQKDIPPFVSSDHSNNPFNTSNSNNPNGTSTLNNQTSSTNNNADPQSVSRIKALLSQADNDNDIGQGDDDGKTSFGEWQALEDDYRFDLDTIQGDIDLKETELADLRDTFDSLDQSVDSDRQQALELKRQYDQLNKELAALRSKENDYQTSLKTFEFIDEDNFSILSAGGDETVGDIVDQMAQGSAQLTQGHLDMFEMKENEHHVETLKELKPLYEELVGSDFDDEEGFSQEQLNNLKNQLSDTLSAMDITDDDYFLYKRALNAVTYLAEDDNFNKIAQTSVIEDKDTTHITEAELATIAAAGSDEQTILSDKDLAVAKDFDKYLEVLPQYAPTIDILKEIYEEAGLDEITNMSEHVLGVINHNNRVLGISIGSKYLSNPESIRVAKYKEKLKAFAEEQTGDKKAAAEFLNKYISFISNAFGNKSKLELNDFELADQAGFGDPDLISGVNESDGRLSLNDIAALGDDYSIFNNENDLDSVTRKKVLNNSRYKNLLTDGVITMDELIKMINTKLDGNYNKNNDTAKFILDFFHVIASLDGDESTISQSDLEEMFNISGGDTVNIGALMAKYLETARKKQTEELDELIG